MDGYESIKALILFIPCWIRVLIVAAVAAVVFGYRWYKKIIEIERQPTWVSIYETHYEEEKRKLEEENSKKSDRRWLIGKIIILVAAILLIGSCICLISSCTDAYSCGPG